jgi:hypothetical protein
MYQSRLQEEKQCVEIVSIDNGRQIGEPPKRASKAGSPKIEIVEPTSNVRMASSLHWQKQRLAIASIVRNKTIRVLNTLGRHIRQHWQLRTGLG